MLRFFFRWIHQFLIPGMRSNFHIFSSGLSDVGLPKTSTVAAVTAGRPRSTFASHHGAAGVVPRQQWMVLNNGGPVVANIVIENMFDIAELNWYLGISYFLPSFKITFDILWSCSENIPVSKVSTWNTCTYLLLIHIYSCRMIYRLYTSIYSITSNSYHSWGWCRESTKKIRWVATLIEPVWQWSAMNFSHLSQVGGVSDTAFGGVWTPAEAMAVPRTSHHKSIVARAVQVSIFFGGGKRTMGFESRSNMPRIAQGFFTYLNWNGLPWFSPWIFSQSQPTTHFFVHGTKS